MSTPENFESGSSALLCHAQAAFMEWIKMIELELGTAADWYGKTEAALRAGDVKAYGTAVGKAWGHTENALKLVRDATRRGFEPDSRSETLSPREWPTLEAARDSLRSVRADYEYDMSDDDWNLLFDASQVVEKIIAAQRSGRPRGESVAISCEGGHTK